MKKIMVILAIMAIGVITTHAGPTNSYYGWIPEKIRAIIQSKYPNWSIPDKEALDIYGDEAFYFNMLGGGDKKTAYAVKGDFNCDKNNDFAVILFAKYKESKERVKFVAVLSKRINSRMTYTIKEFDYHVGIDYFLTVIKPGKQLTAAGKGYASEPDEPPAITFKCESIGFNKAESAASIIWWDGKEFNRTFTSD